MSQKVTAIFLQRTALFCLFDVFQGLIWDIQNFVPLLKITNSIHQLFATNFKAKELLHTDDIMILILFYC